MYCVILENFNFLHSSLLIPFPTQSCLVFHFLCASLLLSLIVWFIISSLSPNNPHLLFCCLLSIWLKYLVLMALFVSPKVSLSLLCVGILHEISLVCHLTYPYTYFSTNICFLAIVFSLFIFILSVLLLGVVISPSLLLQCSFLVLILLQLSILLKPLPPSFLGT